MPPLKSLSFNHLDIPTTELIPELPTLMKLSIVGQLIAPEFVKALTPSNDRKCLCPVLSYIYMTISETPGAEIVLVAQGRVEQSFLVTFLFV